RVGRRFATKASSGCGERVVPDLGERGDEGVLHRGGVGPSLRWFEGKGSVDERSDRLGHFGCDASPGSGGTGGGDYPNFVAALAVVHVLTGQESEHRGAHGPAVAVWAHGSALSEGLFRGHEGRGTHGAACLRAAAVSVGRVSDSEVEDLQLCGVGDENVLW